MHGCACDAGQATTEWAARLASMCCGGRGKLRLILCAPRTVRNGLRLRRSSLDKVCRDNPPYNALSRMLCLLGRSGHLAWACADMCVRALVRSND